MTTPPTMTIDQQVAYLMQGTEYGDDEMQKAMAVELKERLIAAQREGRPLRVYCGFDPRTSDLHLGHTVPMRKLRQFQELGHDVTFVIGNYTSLIGDPSDKDKLRPQLTPQEVEDNARTYAEQAFKILDPEQTTIRYNAEWLSELSFADLIRLASNFTVQQFLTRENFRKRLDHGEAIYLHETFYALMQGYDAYALQADVQVGGTDQLFNIVTAARKLMSFLGDQPNIGMILGDPARHRRRSQDEQVARQPHPAARDARGYVRQGDERAGQGDGDYFRLVTRWTPDEIQKLEQGLADGRLHPRDVKMRLAHEIVSIFHSPEAADTAQEAFIRVFQQGDTPEAMDEYPLQDGQTVLDVLTAGGLVDSNSQARRLIQQNAVRLDGETLDDPFAAFPGPGVLQVGKRRFLKVVA